MCDNIFFFYSVKQKEFKFCMGLNEYLHGAEKK